MTEILYYIVPLIYAGFVALDILSIFPRMAGSIIQKNGIAYSFQVITTAFKRIFVVAYPPLLGAISISGSLDDMFRTVLISYTAGVFVWMALFSFRIKVVAFYCAALDDFSQSGRLAWAFLAGIKGSSKWNDAAQDLFVGQMKHVSGFQGIDKSIFFTAVWIFFFFSATPFLINIIGMQYSDYASVILQLNGVSSALGTIALAFLLDPKLSRIYEAKRELPIAARSLLLSHLVNLCVVGPAFFITLFVFMT